MDPIEDLDIGQLDAAHHVVRALGVLITNVVLNTPAGKTVTFKNQQIVVIKNLQEFIVSDWMMDQMGIKP